MAAHEVLADDPADGIIALELGETWFDLRPIARFPSVPTIQQFALVHDDGIAETVGGDVVGQLLQIVLAEGWENPPALKLRWIFERVGQD